MYKNELKLPIEEFIMVCHEQIPASYGKMMVKKIIHDCKNKLNIVPDYEERGDIRLFGKSHYEVKTSFTNKRDSFGIRNIRPWQSYDYFILCLIDTRDGKYKPHFYCVPKETIINHPVLVFTGQNNTKISNENNKQVGLATSFNADDHFWLFGKDNILEGTSYKDLMNYFEREIGKPRNTSKISQIKARNPIQRIYLKMNKSDGDIIINGRNNQEVMINLVQYIGPTKLEGIIWNMWLNKVSDKNRNQYVGDGYYLNPKFSIRDFTSTVNKINQKLNFSFNIIKK